MKQVSYFPVSAVAVHKKGKYTAAQCLSPSCATFTLIFLLYNSLRGKRNFTCSANNLQVVCVYTGEKADCIISHM